MRVVAAILIIASMLTFMGHVTMTYECDDGSHQCDGKGRCICMDCSTYVVCTLDTGFLFEITATLPAYQPQEPASATSRGIFQPPEPLV